MTPASTLAASPELRLKVGSWPGYESRHNSFVSTFLDGLEAAGCEIISLPDAKAIRYAKVDVLLLHWVDQLFWSAKSDFHILRRTLAFIRALRSRPADTRVVWLVHNLAPHDIAPRRLWMWRRIIPIVARETDAILTLSPSTVNSVRAAIPSLAKLPSLGTMHPCYLPGRAKASDVTRALLGIAANAFVVGYVGSLRPYKGLDQLAAAFSLLPGSHLRLLLAGGAKHTAHVGLNELVSADQRILLEARNLSDAEFEDRLAVCDLFVAPFREYLHSGSLVHALSAGCAVLTPETPFALDLQRLVGGGWVKTYRGELTSGLVEDALRRRPVQGSPDMCAFAPERIGAEVAGFLRGIHAAPPAARRRAALARRTQSSAWSRMAGFQ